jgi:hypothetical protein
VAYEAEDTGLIGEVEKCAAKHQWCYRDTGRGTFINLRTG